MSSSKTESAEDLLNAGKRKCDRRVVNLVKVVCLKYIYKILMI